MLLHNSISFVTDSGLLYFSLSDGNLVDHSLDPQCTNIIGSPSRPLGAGSGGWRNGDKPPVPDTGLPMQGRFQALSYPSASCAVGPGGLPKGAKGQRKFSWFVPLTTPLEAGFATPESPPQPAMPSRLTGLYALEVHEEAQGGIYNPHTGTLFNVNYFCRSHCLTQIVT